MSSESEFGGLPEKAVKFVEDTIVSIVKYAGMYFATAFGLAREPIRVMNEKETGHFIKPATFIAMTVFVANSSLSQLPYWIPGLESDAATQRSTLFLFPALDYRSLWTCVLPVVLVTTLIGYGTGHASKWRWFDHSVPSARMEQYRLSYFINGMYYAAGLGYLVVWALVTYLGLVASVFSAVWLQANLTLYYIYAVALIVGTSLVMVWICSNLMRWEKRDLRWECAVFLIVFGLIASLFHAYFHHVNFQKNLVCLSQWAIVAIAVLVTAATIWRICLAWKQLVCSLKPGKTWLCWLVVPCIATGILLVYANMITHSLWRYARVTQQLAEIAAASEQSTGPDRSIVYSEFDSQRKGTIYWEVYNDSEQSLRIDRKPVSLTFRNLLLKNITIGELRSSTGSELPKSEDGAPNVVKPPDSEHADVPFIEIKSGETAYLILSNLDLGDPQNFPSDQDVCTLVLKIHVSESLLKSRRDRTGRTDSCHYVIEAKTRFPPQRNK